MVAFVSAPVASARKSSTPRIACFGHSKMEQANYAGLVSGTSALNWALFLSGGRARLEREDNGGLAGDWSGPATWNSVAYPGMTARIDAFLAQTKAEIIFCQLFTNDRNGWTADQSIANGETIVAKILAAGRTPVLLTDDPRGSVENTSNSLSQEQLDYAMKVNRWIMSQHGKNGVFAINTWPMLADLTQTNGRVKTGLMVDGLHDSPIASYLKGIQIALFLNRVLPRRNCLPFSNAEVPTDRTRNRGGCASVNPLLLGTAGTKGSNSSGSVADGWATHTGGGGNQVHNNGLASVYSKVTTTAFNSKNYLDDEGMESKDWQQIVLSGTATSFNEIYILGQVVPAANMVAGEVRRMVAEIEVDAGVTGISGFYLLFYEGSFQNYTRAMGLHGGVQSVVWPNRNISGTLQGLDYSVPATPQPLTMALVAKVISGATVSGTVRVRGFGLVNGS